MGEPHVNDLSVGSGFWRNYSLLNGREVCADVRETTDTAIVIIQIPGPSTKRKHKTTDKRPTKQKTDSKVRKMTQSDTEIEGDKRLDHKSGDEEDERS